MKGAFLALFTSVATATVGVDLSTLASTSTYSCMKSNGMNFAIPRAYCSYGGVDANGKTNVANAKAAGIQYVDVYMFPCRSKSATDQVNQLVNALGASMDGEQTDEP